MFIDLLKGLFAPVQYPELYDNFRFDKKSELNDLIQSQNWDALFSWYKNASQCNKHAIVVNLYEHEASSALLSLPKKFPNHYCAYLFCSAVLTAQAVSLRTKCLASEISDVQWEAILSLTEKATNSLLKTLEVNAKDPQVYYFLIQVQTISNSDRQMLWDYIDSALALTDAHFPLYSSVLNFATKKWGGSYEEMFAFAKRQNASKNAVPCMQALIAQAHVERWLGFAFDQEFEPQTKYFSDELVQQELLTSYQIFKKHAEDNGFCRMGANQFAFAFYVSGQNALLRDALMIVNGDYLTRPWCYGAVPEQEVLHDALKRAKLES